MRLNILAAFVVLKNAINFYSFSRFAWLKTIFSIIRNKMSNFLKQPSNITSTIITLKSEDKKQCYDICERNVTIVGSAGTHDHGSSKVKLKNIVDYKWETKNYPGHLIAVHMDGKHYAYVIKVNNKVSGGEGMVRVANANSGQRALIKGMSGEVLDLQFAHMEKDRILACIDHCSLHIHKIDMLSENLICNLLLHIEDPISGHVPIYDKVCWCPYVPEESNDVEDEVAHLIVWSRRRTFQCFNVNAIISAHGIGKHEVKDITEGYLKLSDYSSIITWVTLSPDGSTLGVGSEDGYIRFYQVYFHEKEPRCLHQWNPHNGKAVSSFFFLDNLTKIPDSYWKHAITGADQNTEFKVWDCGSWECLQTVSISPSEQLKQKFLAEVDQTSSYLVATNVESRSMYVFQIVKDEIIEDKSESDLITSNSIEERKDVARNKTVTAFIKSVSEFPLQSPILSFSIIDAAVRKYKFDHGDNYLLEEMEDYEEDSGALYCIVVRMFVVQPKSVQECHILYQPTVDETCEVKSSISNDSSDGFKDRLTDVSNTSTGSREQNSSDHNGMSTAEKISLSPVQQLNSSSEKNKSISPARISAAGGKNFPQVNLMTPEAFSAPAGKKSPDCVSSEVLSTILMLASVTGSSASINKAENVNLLNLVNNKMIEDQEHQKIKDAMAKQKASENNEVRHNTEIISGGSSPSREVQEIMCLQDFNCTEYYNETPAEEKPVTYTADDEKPSNAQIMNEKFGEQDNSTEDSQNKTLASSSWTKKVEVRNTAKYGNADAQDSSNDVTVQQAELKELNTKMSQLISIVQSQSSEISKLKNEVTEMRKIKSDNSTKFRDYTLKLEKQLSKLLEEYLCRYQKEHNQKLEAFVATKNSHSKALSDDVNRIISQFIYNELAENLKGILSAQIQRSVVPVVAAKLDGIKQTIQIDVAEKLASTDELLKENIAQVCKSKSIIDAFGNSVLIGVQNGFKTTYIDSLQNILIPAYEKSSQEMFKQLHKTFSMGIKDVMDQFDNYLTQVQPVQDSTEEIIDKVNELRKHLDVVLPKQKSSDLVETRKELKNLETNLVRNVADIIQKEMKKGFASQAASLEDSVLSAVRSQAQTPAPSVYDVQDQIKLLLSQGQINKAFHQALLANDLSLVEYTLEKADHKSVFNPCLLEQTVLLSLIQQISADMNHHNDIKQRYLSDAILNLNQSDPITKEHAPKVMSELYRNCQCFLSTNPKSSLCSNIRMIMMAVQGMGYKIF